MSGVSQELVIITALNASFREVPSTAPALAMGRPIDGASRVGPDARRSSIWRRTGEAGAKETITALGG